MFFIEKVSKNIVSAIYKNSSMDKDEREIIEYGALILLLKILGISFVIIFGFIFGVILEALAFYFTVSILRKYSGGVHATSPTRCIIIGTFIAVVVPILINEVDKNLQLNLFIFMGIIILIFCYYTIFKLAPVDSPAKPIVNIEMRKQLKNQSMLTMFIMSILLVLLIMLYINYRYVILLRLSQCICIGVLWQCFTLTETGHIIIGKIDNILKYITGE